MAETDISELPRLNNNEFLNYISQLELEELLMTQIKVNGSWDFLFKALFKKENQLSSLTCIACKKVVECQKFSDHIKDNSHDQALKSVEQFYHPYYTYDKDIEQVTRNKDVSVNDTEIANRQTDSTIVSAILSKAKIIAKCIREQGARLSSFTENESLANIILAKDVTKPEDLWVDVKLPLADILNIEFSIDKGKWIRMVTVNKTASTKFYCALCSKFCFGIITVDSHFKGLAHKRAQVACLAVRCSGYKNLTKNCVFGYGEKFSIHIKKTAKQSFKSKSFSKSLVFEKNNVESKTENVNMKIEVEMLEITGNVPLLSDSVADKIKNIKEKLGVQNKNVEGLIGVEYVVKILKTASDKYPMYECVLCEIVLNENRMQGHITGYNHRLKYCELHYPNTIEKFKNIIGHVKYIDYFNAMNHILSKIAAAIEEHHGRSTPFVVLLSTFTKMRTELIAQIYSYPNASQQHGPSFTNVISDKEIKQIASEHLEYVAQTNNYARFAEIPEQRLYLNQRCHDPTKRNGENFDIRKRKHSPSPSNNKNCDISSCSRSPQNVAAKKKRHSRQHLVNTQQISSFHRDEVAIATYEIERMYKEYRKNPESHPLYDEEWNGFWRRRKEQLISQGIDHRSHNYQPEWVKYFKNRLEELYEKEISDSKMELRKQLSENKSNSSLNLFEDVEDFGPAPNNAYGTINQVISEDTFTRSHYMESENTITDGKPTVIHVLRLLTALEEYLGSLGTKIMNLLSKALVAEKNCSNNFELEQHILSFDNCSLLETAVEKLKGILFAGLLDRNKLQGFNRVIQFTTDLLKYADKKGWRNMQSSYPNKVEKPVFLKLADAVQNTRSNTFSSNQKSLSDTLMELLSMQKNNTKTAFNNHLNQKTYSDQEMHIPSINQYFRGSHWQNLGKNSSNLLGKSPYFERNSDGVVKNDTTNDNFTNNIFKPPNFVNVGTLGNIPDPNYKPIVMKNFYQNEDFTGATKRNTAFNNHQC